MHDSGQLVDVKAWPRIGFDVFCHDLDSLSFGFDLDSASNPLRLGLDSISMMPGDLGPDNGGLDYRPTCE